MAMNERNFALGIPGFHYADLHDTARLEELYDLFRRWLAESDAELADRYERYRREKGAGWKPQEISEVIIDTGRRVDGFVGMLFGVAAEQESLKRAVSDAKPLFRFKKDFLQRRVWKKYSPADKGAFSYPDLELRVSPFLRRLFADAPSLAPYRNADEELAVAAAVDWLMALELDFKRAAGVSQKSEPLPADATERLEIVARAASATELASIASAEGTAAGLAGLTRVMEAIEQWAFARAYDPAQKETLRRWVSYHAPEPTDYMHLVDVLRPDPSLPEEMTGPEETLRRRDGFKLTDRRFGPRRIMDEVDYCIFCHDRDKDSCSKGMREKEGTLKRNPLGIRLTGCPLDEKISEMHFLKNEGLSIGALAAIIIDNPMLPGTGHRICNDCMKACIYQKQDPVNIPQIETGVLTDVLNLPYGFEIYSFLTRWNPLNVLRPCALPYNGKNVLVVGLGPAGYTLSHYLLNEGFGVVGVDGLKIEPLSAELTGREGECPAPVRWISSITRELDERVMTGFGGVSEYGITVRWDKNFLEVIYLTLSRREKFRMFGGVRFGGTITIDDAWALGFEHIAIATGAGKPTIVPMKNNLSRGIRMASDFLMGLQLTGAAKKDSLANLQVQLPAVVIGGGLTAIDTATELMAYYPLQVEKFRGRFRRLAKEYGEEAVWKLYDEEEKLVARRFLEHAQAICAERERAAAAGEEPDFVPLLRSWGGVRIVYRKEMADAPAYRLNHEEIIKALEEGISFIECHSPVEAKLDRFGHVEEMVFARQIKSAAGKWRDAGETVTLPARSVLVAAGTSPNTIYERENPGTFRLDKWNQYFLQHVREEEDDPKEAPEGATGFFTSYHRDGKYITYYGDNHPVFAGNVVRAMASAREGYRQVVRLFEEDLARIRPEDQPAREEQWRRLAATMEENLFATVVEVKRYTPTIVDVVVRAPFAARKFNPGQFYRLQNFEKDAVAVEGTKLTMEGLALTGAWVDKEKGLLSMIVLEMGSSSRLCASLAPGQRVVVMGPTGAPTEIPEKTSVLLAGGGLGNAVLFSIARALTENGCRVIYFAGYKKGEDLYKREEIEAATAQVVWSTDAGAVIEPHRPQDRHFRGNIVQAMKAYGDGLLGEQLVPLHGVTRIIAIGSDRMMAAVKEARYGELAAHFNLHTAIGSINSPMQCMMKEVCAQCLQRHVDPATGEESGWVFSCFNQDQQLDEVDFKNLNDRLRQNIVLEKLSNLFLDYLLTKQPVAMI